MKTNDIPTALHSSFPNLLRQLRLDHNYTQKDVGIRLNMTRQGYGYYERGERRMTLPMMSVLAELYQVNILDFIILELSDFDIVLSLELLKKRKTVHTDTADQDIKQSQEPVSQAELLLLDYYRALPPSVKNDINCFLKNRCRNRRAYKC